MAALEVDDLAIGDRATSPRFSWAVEAGEVVGIDVADGPGHALARTIVGLERPASGQIRVAGVDVTDDLPDARWVGHLVVGAELLPHLSVERNIAYGTDDRLQVRRLRRDEVLRLEAQLQLDHDEIRDQLPHRVTAEARFRAGLARAALHAPGALVVEVPDGVALPRGPADFAPAVLPGEPQPAVVVCTGNRALLALLDRVVGSEGPAS